VCELELYVILEYKPLLIPIISSVSQTDNGYHSSGNLSTTSHMKLFKNRNWCQFGTAVDDLVCSSEYSFCDRVHNNFTNIVEYKEVTRNYNMILLFIFVVLMHRVARKFNSMNNQIEGRIGIRSASRLRTRAHRTVTNILFWQNWA
jgi:hypothetical protein